MVWEVYNKSNILHQMQKVLGMLFSSSKEFYLISSIQPLNCQCRYKSVKYEKPLCIGVLVVVGWLNWWQRRSNGYNLGTWLAFGHIPQEYVAVAVGWLNWRRRSSIYFYTLGKLLYTFHNKMWKWQKMWDEHTKPPEFCRSLREYFVLYDEFLGYVQESVGSYLCCIFS